MKLYFFFLLSLLVAYTSSAQTDVWKYYPAKEYDENRILNEALKKDFGLPDAVHFEKAERDTHRFRQFFNNKAIIGAEIRILYREDKYLIKGRIAEHFIDQVKPISAEKALNLLYDQTACAGVKQVKGLEFDEMYYPSVNSEGHTFYVPAIRISGNELCNNPNDYIISLNEGKILDVIPMIAGCKPDSLKTKLIYNQGIQSINVHFDGQSYELRDNCRTNYYDAIITMSGFGSNPVETIQSENNNWDSGLMISGIQLHWGNSRFYDFMNENFNRISYDNMGSPMISILDSTQLPSAGFSYNGMYSIHAPGDKDPDHYWVSLDIVGHEWTHAILFNENILKWDPESRAINEGICDIIGTCFEIETESKYDSLKSGDWLFAEDVDPGPIRDLASPGNFQNPDTYNSTLYHNASNKYGRSAISSYWFYLLSQGGMGINSHLSDPYQYSVNGIGINKALAILYRSITNYLHSSSNYLDLRRSTQLSAIDLFGSCSNEFLSTTEAWNAVGVYDSLQFCQPMNLSESNDIIFSIYPNPSEGDFTVVGVEPESVEGIQIYNSAGYPMKAFESHSDREKFLIKTDLPQKGIYILEIRTNQNVYRRKFQFKN